MNPKITIFVFLAFFHFINAQSPFNLGFEKIDPGSPAPAGWDMTFKSGGAAGYLVQLDSAMAKEGRYALTILPDPATGTQSFGACSYAIPATYSGRTIELKGYMKTLDVSQDGFAGLWLRLDGLGGALAFNNMEEKQIRGTNDWKEYSIELPLHDETDKIMVGGLLVGTGQMWMDDLRLFIDGKPIELAPEKAKVVLPALQDTAFRNGSGVELSALTPVQLENLIVTGKVWGFVKYYHPEVADGQFNMDFELFRILPAILACKNTGERDRVLVGWIDHLGKVPACRNCPLSFEEDAKQKPSLEWLQDDRLSRKLRDKLQVILENRNRGKHFYISLAPNVGNPIFKNEDPYPQFEYPDAGFRLLALFRYWNIIQYFFPYKYAIGRDWDDVLEEFIPFFVQADDALAYRLVLLNLIGNIHDTHANIWSQDSLLRDYVGTLYPPFQVKFVENKAVVTAYYNEELGKASGVQIGDVIAAIDGIPVEDILGQRLSIYPASNYPTKLRDIARNLLRGNRKECTLTLFRDGEKQELTFNRSESQGLNLMIDWAYNQPDSCYRLLNDSIGYLYLGNIQGEKLEAIFKAFQNTKGMVIDIRNYPSDFVVFSLGQYLVPQPRQFVKFTNGDINYPGLFHWTATLEVGATNPDYYKGKVILLINEITQSSAEYHTMAFRTAPNVTVIGSTTAGADGNVSPFYLPGNLRTMITGIGVYYPDGTETQRVGIIPDIEVKPTIKGIKEGRDELLEKALDVIEKER